jgi:copper resistance protein C
MTMRNALLKLAASFAFALAATSASAHAQLEQAVPTVGGTVAAPSEIRLKFSEGVEPHFSGIAVTAEGGGAVPLSAPSIDPNDPSVLIAKVGKPLAPGVYTVTWHAVSVDTHKTQGSFSFTVSP